MKRGKRLEERQRKRLCRSECKLAEALEMEVGSSDLERHPQVSKTVCCRCAKEARINRSLYLGGLSKMS